MLSAVYVSFQPEGAAPPPGYRVDAGSVFGDRGDGQFFGWNTDHAPRAVERMLRGDARIDTFVAFESGGVWEIELPNGTYDVRLSVGDAGQASTHTIVVEGAWLIDDAATAAGQFLQASAEIVVADGRLTIDQGPLPDGSTRLNYVEILPDATPGNSSPFAPRISEPELDGRIVNPADVHLEIIDYFDPDGDAHLNTDWEIRTAGSGQLVWETPAIGGLEKVHTHLGDGAFVGSHAGRSELLPDTDYVIRVRVRDARSAESSYAIRTIRTGSPTAIFGLAVQDVLSHPAPNWVQDLGPEIVLPAGLDPPRLSLESPQGETLLEFRGFGATNELINPPALGYHAPLRIVARGGDVGFAIPQTRLSFHEASGAEHEIYLPSLALGPHEVAVWWVAAGGATYTGDLDETEPNFSHLARGAPVPWLVRQPGYVVEVVATGFQLPVNIAFVPNPGPGLDDPLYYVAELYGTIKMVTRGGAVSDYATNLLNFNPTGNFPGSGEQGMAGIVVDPIQGDLYVGMLYSVDPSNDLAPHYPKVVRFTSADGGRTAATQTTILDMFGETQGQSHQISNFTFGPDDKLYVHNGDGFFGSTAQNLNSFRGKVLRMNRDGTPAADNPFYDGAPFTARDYVFALGMRNPFGGAWRVSDGVHYAVENGQTIDRLAQVVAGRNFGWSTGNDASMLNFATYNWIPSVAPVNIAFIESGVFEGSAFPPDKFGHAYVTESGPTYATGPQARGKKITEFEVGSQGEYLAGPKVLVEYNGTGKASAAALAAGPDGLYFSDLYKDLNYASPIDRGANILRIRFEGFAAVASDRTVAEVGQPIQFLDVSQIPDPVAWEWDFGDGQTSHERNPLHSYASTGDYDVRLIVTTSGGRLLTVVEPDYVRVDVAPRVIGVEVGNGVTWYALPVGSGEQLRTVPLGGGVDRVRIAFDRPVAPAMDHLTVSGERLGSYAVAAVAYDPALRAATWSFSASHGDRVELALAATLLSKVGLPLDGEWTNPAALADPTGSVFPSGDARGGGDFVFRFTVLPGDANRDNVVSGADFTIWNDNFDGGEGPGGKTFDQGDFSGDGFVSGEDYTIWADNFDLDYRDLVEPPRAPDATGPSVAAPVEAATRLAPPLPARVAGEPVGQAAPQHAAPEMAPARARTALRPRVVDLALMELAPPRWAD